MSDDNSTFTRRRVLGGMATIGAAGAVGAGTWAQFSDTESASVTVTAGTLDLKVEGGDPNGVSFELQNVAPGDDGSRTITLKNEGSIAGKLVADLDITSTSEGTLTEPEEEDDPDNSGDLDEYLELNVSGDFGSSGWQPLNFFADETPYPLDSTMNGGESHDITIKWRVPSDVDNRIQGDTVSFDLTLTLTQK